MEIKKGFSSFIYGWIFGFSYFFSNIYWIANSLTVEEIFTPLIPFAITLIPLFLGIFYGISFLIFFYFKPRKKIVSILLFALSSNGSLAVCLPAREHQLLLRLALMRKRTGCRRCRDTQSMRYPFSSFFFQAR